MSIDTETFMPPIVCLCGSTKFKQAFEEATERETLAGRVVVSVGFFAHAMSDEERRMKLTPEVKTSLDELHLRKIDLADEVLILNVGGYLGSSTRREAWYAAKTMKIIRWLEPVRLGDRTLDGSDLLEYVHDLFSDWAEWRAAGEAATRG